MNTPIPSSSDPRVATFERLILLVFNGGAHWLVPEVYTEDCVFIDASFGGEVSGLDNLEAVVIGYREAFPDIHYDIVRVVQSADNVIAHWTCRGTHQGPLWGAPGSGRTFVVRGVSIARFRGDKICHVEQHWQVHRFCDQLGLTPPQGQPGPDSTEWFSHSEDLLELMGRFPLHKKLGFELLDAEDGRAQAQVTVIPEVVNAGGVLHGGVLYTVLDVTAFCACVTVIPDGTNAATHDIHVQVLRASPPGAVVQLSAEVRKVGKRLVFVDAEATLDGKTVALARVTKSLIPLPGAAGPAE
ncbi:MAG: ester cyclase [Deltaproteobacteria bacterium]|nr:ester cyclase [Deltaproteobacteria bacterium]